MTLDGADSAGLGHGSLGQGCLLCPHLQGLALGQWVHGL